MSERFLPPEIAAIRRSIREFFDSVDDRGRKPNNAKYGVYALYDYDGEPVYVGQTKDSLRERIGRHVTGQRSDAVVNRSLDPLEIAEIEVFPLYDLDERRDGESDDDHALRVSSTLKAAEYTLYRRVVRASKTGSTFNTKVPPQTQEIELPDGYRGRVVPKDVYERRSHADVKIGQMSRIILGIAEVVSQRNPPPGLRRNLLRRIRRLENLAERRLGETGDAPSAQSDDEDDALF